MGSLAENVASNNVAGNFVFMTTDNNFNYAERMRISADGNVGIGTINPSSKLHIHLDSTWESEVLITGNHQPTLRLDDTGDANSLGFQLRQANESLIIDRKEDPGTVNSLFAWHYPNRYATSYLPMWIIDGYASSRTVLRLQKYNTSGTSYFEVIPTLGSGDVYFKIDNIGNVGIGTATL
jgi:hypothetical protein